MSIFVPISLITFILGYGLLLISSAIAKQDVGVPIAVLTFLSVAIAITGSFV